MEKSNSKGPLLIANALFWAAVMLGTSAAFKGEPWSEYIIFGGLFGFIVFNGILITKKPPRC